VVSGRGRACNLYNFAQGDYFAEQRAAR